MVDKFKKAVDIYETLREGSNLGKLAPFDVICIGWILDDLKGGDVSGTHTPIIAEWFKKKGFTVKREGVGWEISL